MHCSCVKGTLRVRNSVWAEASSVESHTQCYQATFVRCAYYIFSSFLIVNIVAAWHKALYMILRYFWKAQSSPDEIRLPPAKSVEAQGRFKHEHWIQKLSVGTNCADFHRLSDPGIYIFFLFRSRQQHRVQFNLNFRITWNWNGSHAMIVHEFKQESDWHALVFVWRPEVQ